MYDVGYASGDLQRLRLHIHDVLTLIARPQHGLQLTDKQTVGSTIHAVRYLRDRLAPYARASDTMAELTDDLRELYMAIDEDMTRARMAASRILSQYEL